MVSHKKKVSIENHEKSFEGYSFVFDNIPSYFKYHVGGINMPRRSKNARGKPRRKKVNVRLIRVKDDGISPGRIVACAEYIKE